MKEPGYYVIHNNKVYNATRDPETKEVILFTEDKSEKRNGFKRDWSVKGLYYKKVGIPRIDKVSYEMLINRKEIERLFDEKEPVWGFEKKDEPLNLE